MQRLESEVDPERPGIDFNELVNVLLDLRQVLADAGVVAAAVFIRLLPVFMKLLAVVLVSLAPVRQLQRLDVAQFGREGFYDLQENRQIALEEGVDCGRILLPIYLQASLIIGKSIRKLRYL